MDNMALIALTYVYTAAMGFLTGKYLLFGKGKLLKIVLSVMVFFASFIILWAMLYITLDVSLYDVYRETAKTTVVIIYLAIFRAYIFVFTAAAWMPGLLEKKTVEV